MLLLEAVMATVGDGGGGGGGCSSTIGGGGGSTGGGVLQDPAKTSREKIKISR